MEKINCLGFGGALKFNLLIVVYYGFNTSGYNGFIKWIKS